MTVLNIATLGRAGCRRLTIANLHGLPLRQKQTSRLGRATHTATMLFMPRLNAHVRQGACLPHWTKEGATYHVRFRLADSLPQRILKEWQREKEELLKAKREKRRLTREENKRLQELSSEKVERYLRAGYGACWLQRDDIAQIMANTLRRYDGTRYQLYAWCIMPNHVHAVVQPLTKPLHTILDVWKSVSARKANKLLKRSGAFWQVEYFDHLIRNEEGFQHAIEYTWNNPDEAGLKNWKWRWKTEGGVAWPSRS